MQPVRIYDIYIMNSAKGYNKDIIKTRLSRVIETNSRKPFQFFGGGAL